jgi:cell division septation protein DedD
MTNRQAVTTFVFGIGFLLVAFWAGLTIARNGGRSPANLPVVKNSNPSPTSSRAASSQRGPSDPYPSLTQEPNVSSNYIVRVAAFGTQELADRLSGELKHKYMSAHTQEPAGGDDSLYRVDIGPYANRDEAEQVARELATEGRKGIMIMPENGDKPTRQ